MKQRKILLGVMLLLLLLPTCAHVMGIGDLYAINENRIKRRFPTLEEIKANGFYSINEWFNDNYAMRDVLIRGQHQIDYSLFGYSKGLFLQKTEESEYLFYRSVVALEQIVNERMTEDQRSALIEQLQAVKERIESKDICFKFFIAPQKNEILDEEGNLFPVKRPEKNMYYVIQEKIMESNLKDNYVEVVDILKEKNKIKPVYYYTDFHWNSWGAACAFGKGINSYAKELGMKGDVYNVDNLEFETFIPNYNDQQLINLSVLYYNIPEEYTANSNQINNSKRIALEEYPNYAIWENVQNPIFNKSVLLLGDSYTAVMLGPPNGTHLGIIDLFPRVYFCHWDKAANLLENIPEDVGLVIVERIESALPAFGSELMRLYETET